MMGRRPWTIKDDDQLRVLAATGETSGSIAVRLKRSAAAIRKRAISSGIVLAGSTKAPGAEGEAEMTYDVYRAITDSGLRMATRPGAGLPNHVEPEDWELMPAGTSQLIDDIDVDIADRGFCFFRLVSK